GAARSRSCGGSPREGARSEAEQRLAAGGPQRSPDQELLQSAEGRGFHQQPFSFQVHLVRFRSKRSHCAYVACICRANSTMCAGSSAYTSSPPPLLISQHPELAAASIRG